MTRWQSFQVLLWLGFLYVVLAGGHARNYVGGFQVAILIAAGAVMAVLAAAVWIGARADERGAPVAQTAVHALPLVLFLVVGPTTLGSDSLNSSSQLFLKDQGGRFAGDGATVALPSAAIAATATATAPSPLPSAPLLTPPAAAPPAPVVAAAPASALLSNVEYVHTDLTSLRYPPFVGGGAVEIIAKVMADRDRVSTVGDIASAGSAIYRHMVVCCAADAIPVGAVLDRKLPAAMAVDSWVRIRGFADDRDGPLRIPTITVISVDAIPEPAEPYLYPGARGRPPRKLR